MYAYIYIYIIVLHIYLYIYTCYTDCIAKYTCHESKIGHVDEYLIDCRQETGRLRFSFWCVFGRPTYPQKSNDFTHVPRETCHFGASLILRRFESWSLVMVSMRPGYLVTPNRYPWLKSQGFFGDFGISQVCASSYLLFYIFLGDDNILLINLPPSIHVDCPGLGKSGGILPNVFSSDFPRETHGLKR